MSFGIILSDTNIKEDITYDSRRPRPQIALERDPSHLRIVEVKGSNIATNAGNGYYNEETLYEFKHNLGYKPINLTYFYVLSNESYGCGKYFYGFGATDDYLTVEVDEASYKVKHIVKDYLSVGYTSNAATIGKIRVKFMIFSNPINKVTNEALDT